MQVPVEQSPQLLSQSVVRTLREEEDLDDDARKFLAFSDNRQDASLQAGHFNDFVLVGLIRSALYRAAAEYQDQNGEPLADRASLEQRGERFAAKVLTPAELAQWQERSARWPERGVRYLATRFSAKEAFSKAVGLGMRMPMTWRLCEIGKLPSGKPAVVLHGGLKEWFEAQGLSAHVSVTDETDYAASFVVVEKKEHTA